LAGSPPRGGALLAIEIGPEKSATVRVQLSRAARRQLRAHPRLAARAVVTAHHASGSTRTRSFRLTLVRSG